MDGCIVQGPTTDEAFERNYVRSHLLTAEAPVICVKLVTAKGRKALSHAAAPGAGVVGAVATRPKYSLETKLPTTATVGHTARRPR